MAIERLNVVILSVMVIAAAMQMDSTDAQKTHNVGGPAGWIIPSSPNAFATWAASQTISVGDTLVFNFTTGAHTAAQVTKAAYDACTTTKPIALWSTGPSSVKLNTSGPHYYICTISSHCSLGQKVAITVAATSPASAPSPSATPPTEAPGSTTTPSADAPASTTTPSAPPNSASFVASALPLAILSVVTMALFY